jgi:hypothetical protein
MLESYEWFLEMTGRSEEQVLEWIGERNNRNQAFDKSREFAGQMFELLKQVTAGGDTMRYLVV